MIQLARFDERMTPRMAGRLSLGPAIRSALAGHRDRSTANDGCWRLRLGRADGTEQDPHAVHRLHSSGARRCTSEVDRGE